MMKIILNGDVDCHSVSSFDIHQVMYIKFALLLMSFYTIRTVLDQNPILME